MSVKACDLGNWVGVVQDHWKWRLLINHATFYWSAIVTIALSCTIFKLFDVEFYRDLEIWVRGHSRSLSDLFDAAWKLNCSAFLQLTPRLSNDFTAAWLTFTFPQLFTVAATLKSIDYNVAMTFILNNNNNNNNNTFACFLLSRNQ